MSNVAVPGITAASKTQHPASGPGPFLGSNPPASGRSRALAGFLLLGLTCLAAGCAQAGTRLSKAATLINQTYRTEQPRLLARGDVLEVELPRHPEYNHSTKILPDGYASFHFVDRLRVEGLTLEELDRILTRACKEQAGVADPSLSIRVQSLDPDQVMVLGEVRSPGTVELPASGLTFLEAIAFAGGHTWESASLKNVLFVRWLPDEKERRVWVVDARKKHWAGNDRITLMPRDLIFVPNTPITTADNWVEQWIQRLIPIPLPISAL